MPAHPRILSPHLPTFNPAITSYKIASRKSRNANARTFRNGGTGHRRQPGFGRAIAVALSKHGAHVAGVARDHGRLEELRAQLGDTFTLVAAAPVVAGHLLDKHRPRTLVLDAEPAPLPRPIHRQTWQTFSRNWEVDVQHVFNWTREALLLPLPPGSVVIAISSGAAVNSSPLSGGAHAGAKATIPSCIASSAADESARETGSASGSPRCCRSSLRKQDWARPE